MTLKRKKLRDAIAFALVMGATSAFVTGTAFAQETPATPAPAPTTEEEKATALDTIVVTGTRIQSQTVTASSPVVEIQAEEFQFAGATRVDDLVNSYPQMSPYFDSFANNGATGYPTINLRSLGSQRTLTLVNGNRLAPGAFEVRDISIIPASLVKRVDILTGGASAVYGSDAMAGVVNFILDTEFEGVSLSAGYSAYQHNNDNEYMQGLMDAKDFEYPTGDSGFDGISNNIDLAIGSSFADGRGHAMAWLTWRKNDELFQGERDYSSCALNTSATACGGSRTAFRPNFFIFDDSSALAPFGFTAHIESDGTWAGGFDDLYNYAPINYYQRPDERYTFGSSVKFEINEHFKPYLETMFINRRSAIQVAESGTFFADLLTLECDNPVINTLCADLGLDPSGPIYAYVGKRNNEGGPRHFADETSSYRVVAGLEGAINDSWSYNTSFLYAHTRNDTTGTGDFLADRVVSALLGCPEGSFDGCLLYDVWTPGGVTAEAAAMLQGVSITQTVTSLTSFNAYVSGDLGFGFGSAKGDNVSLVVGTEWREETYDFTADSDSQAGNFTGAGGPALPVGGKISVQEFFVESAVPILKDVGIFKSLSLDLGYRISDYNLSGNAETYKIGFAADMGMVRVRGGFNHAIRAPGTGELFSTNQIALFSGSDPCSGVVDNDPDTDSPDFTVEQCENLHVDPADYGTGTIIGSPAEQYNQFVGGNVDLKPESADTWTFGVVFTPIDDLQFNLDYYDIEIQDTITSVGAQTTLDFCGQTGDAYLCSQVRRNPNTGDLWLGNDPATSGLVFNPTGNFGGLRFRGVDFGASYGWDMFGGRFSTSLQGSYVLEQEISPLGSADVVDEIKEATTYDCAGLINIQCQTPKWRHIANLRYSRDWATVSLRWRYYGEMDYEDNDGVALTVDSQLADDGKLNAYNYFDLSASALIGEWGELTVGVNNIADKEPPLVGTPLAQNGNAPGGYDQAGRFFFANFTVKF